MTVPYVGDVPAVVAFRVIPDGGHLRVRVWIGQDNAPGCVGDLVMRPKDWELLRHLIAHGWDDPFSPNVRVTGDSSVDGGSPDSTDGEVRS